MRRSRHGKDELGNLMELTISQVRGQNHDLYGDWTLDDEPCPRLSRLLPKAVGATETKMFWVGVRLGIHCFHWFTLSRNPACLLRIDAPWQGLHPEEGSERPVVLLSILLNWIK